MSLDKDITEALDDLAEVPQILTLSKMSWSDNVSLKTPEIKFKNPHILSDIKKQAGGRSSTDMRTVWIDKHDLRQTIKSSLVDDVISDIKAFLPLLGFGPRTKFSRWFSNSKYEIKRDKVATEDFYQLYKYMNTKHSDSEWETKKKNIKGLLIILHKKYEGNL
jgi:hypothetical protein